MFKRVRMIFYFDWWYFVVVTKSSKSTQTAESQNVRSQKSFTFLTDNGITLCLLERWFPIFQTGTPCECCPYTATIVYPWHPLWMLLYLPIVCPCTTTKLYPALASPVNVALPVVDPCIALTNVWLSRTSKQGKKKTRYIHWCCPAQRGLARIQFLLTSL